MGELEIFALRLKQLREEMGLSQSSFATLINVKQQTLSGYERGNMKPPLDVARNIATKCNVSLDWLCGLTEKKQNTENMKTLADLFETLFRIEKSIEINIMEDVCEVQYIDFSGCLQTTNRPKHVLYFSDEYIDNFIEEWKKMKNLHDRNTIDNEVYQLWQEKVLLKNHDNLISSHRLIFDDEMPFDQ